MPRSFRRGEAKEGEAPRTNADRHDHAPEFEPAMNDIEGKSSPSKPRIVIFSVCLGLFMTGLSHRALVVSLPTLTEVFHTHFATIQWALLIYDLTLIGLVLTLGRLGDLLGHKRIYVTGFGCFVIGSLLCGLSQSVGQLIFFRAIQAVGASMLNATARAIVAVIVPPEKRGRALGLTSMAFHVGFITGPTLGGFLIDAIEWRWIFFVNIPIGLAGAYLAQRVLPEKSRPSETLHIDIPGAGLLLIASASFLYAMNQLPRWGARDPAFLSLLAVSVVAAAFFIRVEKRSSEPILALSLFNNRLFSAGIASLFFITATQSAIHFLLPFYLQNIRGFTPTQMGWVLVVNSLIVVLVAPVAGWMSDRFGSRLLCTIGSAAIVVGQIFLGFLASGSGLVAILSPMALTGLGWALFNSPNSSAVLGSVPKGKVGAASGTTVTTARVGGAGGIALAATLFTYWLTTDGLTQLEIESPQAWRAAPETFTSAFNRTVHIVNLFAVLSVFFSAARGGRKEA
jgi:EmrB/QacA subfamily drug resistance transporter